MPPLSNAWSAQWINRAAEFCRAESASFADSAVLNVTSKQIRAGQKSSMAMYGGIRFFCGLRRCECDLKTHTRRSKNADGNVGRNPPHPALVFFYKGCGLHRIQFVPAEWTKEVHSALQKNDRVACAVIPIVPPVPPALRGCPKRQCAIFS